MQLILEIISDNKGQASSSSRTFTTEGGTIGRVNSNDWVLADPSRFISSKHAEIVHRNGQFILVDTSSNGVFLNDSEQPIGKGNQVTLQDGDIILINDYEIQARLQGADTSSSVHILDSLDSGIAGVEVDPLKILDSPKQGSTSALINNASAANNTAPTYSQASIANSQVSFPDVGSADETPPDEPSTTNSAPLIPEDWANAEENPTVQPTTPEPDPPPVAKSPEPSQVKPETNRRKKPATKKPATRKRRNTKISPVKAAAERIQQAQTGQMQVKTEDDRFDQFLKALGVSDLSEEYGPEVFAEVFRIMTQGVMEALWARNEVRNQFRLTVTMIQQRGNNPLKFSTDAEDAFYNIFSRPRKGDLGAEDAFSEALSDLNTHQFAVIAGMRAAFESMLKEFNPKLLERKFGKKSEAKESWKDMIFKEDLWDRYRTHFESIAAEREQSFRRLFGEAFSATYEDEILMQKDKHKKER